MTVPRIVILDTSNPDEMTGGQSTFVRNILPYLDGQVRLVGVTGGSEPLGQWQPRLLHETPYQFMPIARMPAPGPPPVVPLRLTSCLGVVRFRRSILAMGNVVYVQSPEMGLPLAFPWSRTPLVLHLHGAENPLVGSRYAAGRNPLVQKAYYRVEKRVIRASSLVMSVDENGVRLCREQSRVNRCELVPTCFDPGVFHPGDAAAARSRLGLPAWHRLLIFVGRLEEAKGTDLLIDALALLAKQRDDVSLVVVGDGSQRSIMAQRARDHGIGDSVFFAGWVDHTALPLWLQAVDLLLLPSRREGLPTVAIEALACGVPVVATAIGGLPDLISVGKNGLFMKARTPAALATTVNEALETDWPVAELVASVSAYTSERVGSLVCRLLTEVVSAHVRS